MNTPTHTHPHPFGSTATIRCERAAAELRTGRPVLLIDAHTRRYAVMALDSMTAQSFTTFANAVGNTHYLFLTPARSNVLGLEAPQGARIPLATLSYDSLVKLAYLRQPTHPTTWVPGDIMDAAATEITRLALLLPAIVAAPLTHHTEHAFADCQTLDLTDLDTAAAGASTTEYELVTRTPVPLRDLGMSEFIVFRGGIAQRDQVAILIGQPDLSSAVPVRVHSSCLTGDLFGSLKCDCGDQLRHGLATLKALGGGVLLYLDQEGRGNGIAAKIRAYGYQHVGLDTIDADAQLGFGPDERRYTGAVMMLRALGITRIQLLSNNPTKVERLRAAGIIVEQRIPVIGQITEQNEYYLRTKVSRAGHDLDIDALIMTSQRPQDPSETVDVDGETVKSIPKTGHA
ncbi:GTP cyclohydrolase [Xylella fastidiosa subsp. pauca]|nr:GTP cyclohydrolase II RibA [Xylella fastidiosa]ARO68431.1 GTP cyclohydrolase [Xylella fastidiosa subsp. pauca]AVI20559.1 GTP cyclohydrolase [Xylella fastidiosa]AVI22577.1 GTP cyclohydrolase [Xylella fastidiosa]KIA57745.1 GTP cyclohydrolase [Xylella fastidiosa]KXB13119.1 GTP cyclohydrolase [Xylella fastidiosa]